MLHDKKTKKAVPKRRPQPKRNGIPSAPQVPPQQPVPESAAPTISTESSSRKPAKPNGSGKNSEKIQQHAESSLAALNQITSPLSMWQQPQRCKETDSKVQKALDRCVQLESISEKEGVQALRKKLSDMANRINKWSEVVSIFKGEGAPQEAKFILETFSTHAETFCTVLEDQSQECVKQMLQDLGKLLIEAS